MSTKTSVLKGPKDVRTKHRLVNTASHSAGTAIATFPKGSRLIGAYVNGVAPSIASCTVNLGTESASATSLGTHAITSGPGFIYFGNTAAETSDTLVYAKITSATAGGTGTASGTWLVSLVYTDGNLINNDTL